MFRVKICGITSVEDARVAVEAGADAIGVNFFSASPRCVSSESAALIVHSVPASVARVGVFVNHAVREIVELADQLSLDWIQLHGDEPADTSARLAPRQVLRAIRVGARADHGAIQHALTQELEACRAQGRQPDALLLDALDPGSYGGTGRRIDWAAVGRIERRDVPIVLAGGLRTANVREAILLARPDAVDVSSGVELAPGKKDPEFVARFVSEARAAFG